ncbi:MAG TPA: hypothetical protein VK184_00670 [Nostocaceae cyanobacterium]|nr:hypothetical protein [Nostocaceae cyanobacterium]
MSVSYTMEVSAHSTLDIWLRDAYIEVRFKKAIASSPQKINNYLEIGS